MKMRNWIGRAAWLLALAIVFTLACGDDDDNGTNPGNGEEISFPLQVGNGWTYDVTGSEEGKAPLHTETTTIVGTETIEGETFYEMEAIEEGEEPDTSYIRQSGQQVLLRANLDTSEFPEEVADAIQESFPWKMADFTASTNSPWTILDYSGEFDEGSIEVTITGKSLGRVDDIAVPAGNYDDVYKGEIVQSFTASLVFPPLTQSTTITQVVYIKDGIGIVKEETTVLSEMTGTEDEVSTTTSVLTAYDVD